MSYIAPIEASNLVAFSRDSVYTIKTRPAHKVPQYGSIRVELPSEIVIDSHSSLE